MRKEWLRPGFLVVATTAFLFVVCNDSYGQEKSDHCQANLKYLTFDGFKRDVRPNGEIVENAEVKLIIPNRKWQAGQMELWKSAIKEAVAILPPMFMKDLGRVRFGFYSDQFTWETAHPEGNTVYVNLLPSIKKPWWMTWETLPLNGFTREEMVFVVLHEIAHIFSFGVKEFGWLYEDNDYRQYQGIAWWDDSNFEAISSMHCTDTSLPLKEKLEVFSGSVNYKGMTFEVGTEATDCHIHDLFDDAKVFDSDFSLELESQPTLYGRERGIIEDFADTFALYVMFPEYLKNFSFRYDITKNILGREYANKYSMSGSLPSRLTLTVDSAKTSGEGK